MSKLVYFGLGSNLGDRAAQLRRALRDLDAPALRVRRVSSIYETAPVDVTGQGWFLNLAAEAETDLFPMQLLHRVQKLEHRLGRRRTVPKGPRTIDIDILFYGHAVIDSPQLTVPHPAAHERRFVLEPLAELAPDLRHPVLRRTVAEMLAGVRGPSVRKYGEAPV